MLGNLSADAQTVRWPDGSITEATKTNHDFHPLMDVDNADFLQSVAAADEHKLDYILIGGLALIFNGAVRFTQDAAIWI